MPNLNELPPDLVPNLNEAPVLDPAEVIIDPPIIPLPYGPAPNVFLDQVNEMEEEQEEDNELLELLNNNLGEDLREQVAKVNLPVLANLAENFLNEEINEDMLLGDGEEPVDEVQPQNLHVGVVPFPENVTGDPVYLQKQNMIFNSIVHAPNRFEQFLAPSYQKGPTYVIPLAWVNFFLSLLMSPKHFDYAKELMASRLPASLLGTQDQVGLMVPNTCPESQDVEADLELEASNNTSPFSLEGKEVQSPQKKRTSKKTILVESQVRRNPRFKELKKGFKSPQCMNKNYLGYNATPPTLSANTIRRIGIDLCNIDPALLTDEELTKKKNKTAPVGRSSSLEKGESSKSF